MSWSFTSKGRSKDVAHHIKQDAHVPQEIKDLVSKFAKEAHHSYGLSVATNGHIGGSCKLDIEAIVLAPQIPDESPEQPPDPNAPTGHVAAPTVAGEPGHVGAA